ncbi:MAG: nucleic acid-binding protein [Spirochaetaceae bacterium]|nr:nucleic acid-binding protein [Spirochaetaceae bacterium]
MEMTDVFDKLKTLQDILVEKYSIETKIEEAPKALVAQDELLSRLKKEYISKNSAYEESKMKILGLRRNLDETVSAKERSEESMSDISTHREYEALSAEIKYADEKEKQVRKELQKEEQFFANLEEDMQRLKQSIDTQQVELDNGKASIANVVESLNQNLIQLKKQEDEIIPDLDPEIIFKFERIIRSKQNKGIVAVRGNVCDGCHMILPAQFANEVHSGENIVFCPYCSRILFYQEQEEGENEYFSIEDAGSLVDLDDDEDEDFDDDDNDERDDIKEMDFDE